MSKWGAKELLHASGDVIDYFRLKMTYETLPGRINCETHGDLAFTGLTQENIFRKSVKRMQQLKRLFGLVGSCWYNMADACKCRARHIAQKFF